MAVLILGISHDTSGVGVLVEFALAEGVLYALDRPVIGALCAGHLAIINMFGRKQLAARLGLLVVGRGSEIKPSGGPSEL
eukprot:4331470-Pyramimonas_sp.AAC.1